MIETDMLYAYVKKEDWLKPAAKKLFSKIIKGEFNTVYVSESLSMKYTTFQSKKASPQMNSSPEWQL